MGWAIRARRGALRGWPTILVSPRCGRRGCTADGAAGPDATASALDDPFLWLGMLAAATTTRIVVGTAAIVLPLRQPLQWRSRP